MANLVQAMLDAGFDLEHCRAAVRGITRTLRPDLLTVITSDQIDAFEVDANRVIASAGGEITYQVHVTASPWASARQPETEHLVTVLARSAVEAELIACQMAACRSEMPLSSQVVTDSTLTVL